MWAQNAYLIGYMLPVYLKGRWYVYEVIWIKKTVHLIVAKDSKYGAIMGKLEEVYSP